MYVPMLSIIFLMNFAKTKERERKRELSVRLDYWPKAMRTAILDISG